jgi:predicted nucleic acid-binding protein
MPDNAVLIETTILVDYLRQSPAAADFLDTARARGSLMCSAVTQAELIVGSRTRAELRAKDSAGKLDEVWPYPVVQFLRGDIDEAALLKLSTDDERPGS